MACLAMSRHGLIKCRRRVDHQLRLCFAAIYGANKTAETVDVRLSGTLRIDILGVELQCYRTAGNGILFT